MNRTLIPEALSGWNCQSQACGDALHDYAVALVVLAGLSALTIAAHIHARWLTGRKIALMPIYTLVMVLVVIGAVALLGWRDLIGDSMFGWLCAPVLGPLVGYAIIQLDTAIVRGYSDRMRQARLGGSSSAMNAGRPGPARIRPAGVALQADVPKRRTVGVTQVSNHFRPTAEDFRFRLSWLIAVAVLEELIFRGALLRLALHLPMSLAIVAISSVIAMFALSHIFFGWVQVLAKTPLSIIATAVTLLTGTVGAAVVAHVFFNWHVWYRRRNLAVAQ
jgi:membrane protease YdiL (CAAX protease family)